MIIYPVSEPDTLSGKKIVIKDGTLVPRGYRKEYLLKQAGIMRNLGLPPEGIRIVLDIQAIKSCVDGSEFLTTHKADLDDIAGWSVTWKGGDRIMDTIKSPATSGINSEISESIIIVTKPDTRHDLFIMGRCVQPVSDDPGE